MNVKTLIQRLSDVDPESDVLLSSDEEGNSFLELHFVDSGLVYTFEDGDIRYGVSDLTAENIEAGFAPEDVIEDGVPCVILWP